ncbi:hypothetical protein ACQY0O_006406 [Thecaphora frezii]
MSQPGTPRATKVHFPEADLDRLQAKLDDARLPKTSIVANVADPWAYGTDLAKLNKVLSHWKAGNPEDCQQHPVGTSNQGVKAWWRSVEDKLNQYPHYEVEIEGITLHYQHFKPRSDAASMPAIPLLFSHGWPGSFTEAYHFAAKLIENRTPAFEVIVPSLPGYGLSSQPPKEGWKLTDTARVFNTLMTSVLGFDSYMAQGGDWGTVVTWALATYPACKIYHTNFAPPTPPTWAYVAFALEKLGIGIDTVLSLMGYSPEERFRLQRTQKYMTEGNGYVRIQRSKPATLGYALYDDPVGILSWLLEKFREWSDPGCPAFAEPGKANSESQLTEENILIDVMIYYLTGSIHTSFLPYKESLGLFDTKGLQMMKAVKDKPFGHSAFPYEILGGPRSWIPRSSFNLIHFRQHQYGGHFAALDNPQGLLEDVAEFANRHWHRPRL